MEKKAEDQKVEKTTDEKVVEELAKLEKDKEQLLANLNATQGAINVLKKILE